MFLVDAATNQKNCFEERGALANCYNMDKQVDKIIYRGHCAPKNPLCVYVDEDEPFAHTLMQRMGDLIESITKTGNDAVGRTCQGRPKG